MVNFYEIPIYPELKINIIPSCPEIEQNQTIQNVYSIYSIIIIRVRFGVNGFSACSATLD